MLPLVLVWVQVKGRLSLTEVVAMGRKYFGFRLLLRFRVRLADFRIGRSGL